jgi:hypothetical protein
MEKTKQKQEPKQQTRILMDIVKEENLLNVRLFRFENGETKVKDCTEFLDGERPESISSFIESKLKTQIIKL